MKWGSTERNLDFFHILWNRERAMKFKDTIKRPARIHQLFLACLLVAILPLELQAEEKTLQRPDDPVVVEGKNLKPLAGGSLDQLALMAFNDGSWTPIPFQIDQKKPDGSYAFTMGPEASADPNPDLDANDELVFMARDTGDRAEDGMLPQGADAGMEIEVNDPKNGNRGWAYLAAFSSPAPRSKKDYIRLERDHDQKQIRFLSDEFMIGLPEGQTFPTDFAMVNPDGSVSPDLLDQVKIPLEIIVPVIKVRFDFRVDRLIKSENKAWIDGPIRVLNLNEGYLHISKQIRFKMGGAMISRIYTNSMEFPLRIEPPEESGGPLSSIPIKMIPEINEYVILDHTSNVYGARFFSQIQPEQDGLVFNGQMSDTEKNLDRETPCYWTALYSPDEGGVLTRISITPPSGTKGFIPRTYFKDDKNMEDPPEEEPGMSGMGFSLYQVDQAVAQMAETNTAVVFNVTIYFKSDFDPKCVRDILDIHDHPLEVHPRPVTLPHGKGN